MTERMCKRILEKICHPKTEWLIVNEKPSRLCIREMHHIPRAWAYFIVQTLAYASNQSEFSVKWCHALMSILNEEDIDVRKLIVKNIKFMDDAP